MQDYYGREINIGDLVLCLPKSQNNFYYSNDRVSLIIGKNEGFRLQRRKIYSPYDISEDVLIKLSPVNTDKLNKKYTELKGEYDKYMQQEINSNRMTDNLEPGDIVIRNNKSAQNYVYIGYGDLIIENSQLIKKKGHLYIALSVFGNISDMKMTTKNIEGHEFSLDGAISYIYGGLPSWHDNVDMSKLIFSKSPIMIKGIKGKLKLSSLNAKYVSKNQSKYIKSVEFKKNSKKGVDKK